MEDVSLIKEIKKAVSTPMMDGAQVGPFVEPFRVYHMDESHVLECIFSLNISVIIVVVDEKAP